MQNAPADMARAIAKESSNGSGASRISTSQRPAQEPACFKRGDGVKTYPTAYGTTIRPSAAPTYVYGRQRAAWESDDAYPAIARFDDRRVIRCKNDLQWILQKRSGQRWRDLGYFRDKDVLLERIGQANPGALAVIAALPALPPGPSARQVRHVTPPRISKLPSAADTQRTAISVCISTSNSLNLKEIHT